MRLVALVFFMTPLVVLVVVGATAAARHQQQPRLWTSVLTLFVSSTTVWLVFAGLHQHRTPCDGKTTGCPTVFGYDAPLPDGHFVGILLLVLGFAVPAAWVGWRRLAPPLTAGATLALAPTILAWWTAPRGDEDGLWTLIFLFLPMLGGLASVVVAVAERVSVARSRRGLGTRELTPAQPSDRFAALAIDAAVVGSVLVVPLTMLSHAKQEVIAGVLGVAVATLYLGVPLARRGKTIGQSLIGLLVLDSGTNRPVRTGRAFLRSLVIVLEVAAAPTIVLAIPAAAELVSLLSSGRTLTDRLFETVVLKERR